MGEEGAAGSRLLDEISYSKQEGFIMFLQDKKLFSIFFRFPLARQTDDVVYYALVRPIRRGASRTGVRRTSFFERGVLETCLLSSTMS